MQTAFTWCDNESGYFLVVHIVRTLCLLVLHIMRYHPLLEFHVCQFNQSPKTVMSRLARPAPATPMRLTSLDSPLPPVEPDAPVDEGLVDA